MHISINGIIEALTGGSNVTIVNGTVIGGNVSASCGNITRR